MPKSSTIATFVAVACGVLLVSACGSDTSQPEGVNRNAGGEVSGDLNKFPGWDNDPANVVAWTYDAGKHPGFDCYTKADDSGPVSTFKTAVSRSTGLPTSNDQVKASVNGAYDSKAIWQYWPMSAVGQTRDRRALRLMANTDGVKTWRGTTAVQSSAATRDLFGPATATSNPAFRCGTEDSSQFFVATNPLAENDRDPRRDWSVTSQKLPWKVGAASWTPGSTFQVQYLDKNTGCATVDSLGYRVFATACSATSSAFTLVGSGEDLLMQSVDFPGKCLGGTAFGAGPATLFSCKDSHPLHFDETNGHISYNAPGGATYSLTSPADYGQKAALTFADGDDARTPFRLLPIATNSSSDPLANSRIQVSGVAYSKRVDSDHEGKGNDANLAASCAPTNNPQDTPLACATTTLASGDNRQVGLVGSYLWTLPLRINVKNGTQQTLIMSSAKPPAPKATAKGRKRLRAAGQNPPGLVGAINQNLLSADGLGPVAIPGASGGNEQVGSVGFLRTFENKTVSLPLSWVTTTPEARSISEANVNIVMAKPFRTLLRLKALSLNSLTQFYQNAAPKPSADQWNTTVTADCAAGKSSVAGVNEEAFAKYCGDLPVLVQSDGSSYNNVRVATFSPNPGAWAGQYQNLQPSGIAASSNLCADNLTVENKGPQTVSLGPDGFMQLTINIAKKGTAADLVGEKCNFTRSLE